MIKDLNNGMNAYGIYLLKEANKSLSAKGNAYYALTLQDSSGSIEAKKFNIAQNDDSILVPGKLVRIDGKVSSYNDHLQIIVDYVYKVDENSDDIHIEDFILSSPNDFNEMKNELKNYINSIEDNELKAIVSEAMKRYYEQYLVYPAAVRNHHVFYHGLLHHSLSMCHMVDPIKKNYPSVNRDLLLAGCILHDLGKIKELSGPIGTEYTKEGNLLGHLVIGTMMINEICNDLGIKGDKPLLLEHMIASHHGKAEYGACVTPATREALLLSMIDDMDAKMMVLDKAFEGIDEGEFTERLFPFENRKFYKE